MGQNRANNRSKMGRKFLKNGTNISKRWAKSGSKMVHKWVKFCLKIKTWEKFYYKKSLMVRNYNQYDLEILLPHHTSDSTDFATHFDGLFVFL